MNDDNLKPFQAGDEAAKTNGRRGGIKSGESRRRRRDVRALLRDLMDAPCPERSRDKVRDLLSIDPDDADMQAAFVASLADEALNGGRAKVSALDLLYRLSGEHPDVRIKEAELRLKRAELKERKRQFDERSEEKGAADVAISAWIEAVFDAEDADEQDGGE